MDNDYYMVYINNGWYLVGEEYAEVYLGSTKKEAQKQLDYYNEK